MEVAAPGQMRNKNEGGKEGMILASIVVFIKSLLRLLLYFIGCAAAFYNVSL